MNTLPPTNQSIVIRRDHSRHQAMLENHQEAKAKRREDHKRNGGRKFRYPGHMY